MRKLFSFPSLRLLSLPQICSLPLLCLVFFIGTSELQAQFCTANYSNPCSSGDLINNFSFNTISNNNTGCNGQLNNYIYYSNLNTTVAPGQTYNISMQSGGSWGQGFGVWIDYNQNSSFTDPGEFVYASPSSGTQVFNGTVTIPTNAIPGVTRMRVRCNFGNTVIASQACGQLTWGETEDYNVTIQTPGPNDLGVTQISAPNSGCNLSTSESVTISITNFGTLTQTGFNVGYRLNNGPVVTENVGTLSIASTNSANFTFATPANLATPGTYTLKAWTSLPADTIPLNDTTTITITSVPGISTYPYFEDFESGNGGWLSGGSANSWAFGTPAKTTIQGAYSGSNAWVTGGLGTTQYNNNEDSYVLGPCFNFGGLVTDPWISMRIWWNCESGWDGTNLQYSTNFGTSWQNVGSYGDPNNWYNNQFITAQPGGSSEGWSGRISSSNGSGGWVLASHELTGLAGAPSIRLRIAFGSDGSVTDDGFAVDNIAIGYPPTVSLGPDSSICGGDTVILDAGPNINGKYFWSTGDTSRRDTITANNVGNGRISVILEDSLGFQAFDTVNIFISVPTVYLGPDTSICVGDTLSYGAANPRATYLWSTSSTDSSIFVANGGTYWVQVTDTVGCIISDTVNITTFQAVNVDLGNDTTACLGQPVTLDMGNQPVGSSILWSTGASTQVLIATGPGTYWGSVVTTDGCTASDTVIVSTLPNPSVSLGANRISCSPVLLDAGNPGATYLWSNNSTNQTITVNSTGTYWVEVTNSLGCSTTDSVTITISTGPSVNLGQDAILCNGQSLTLDAGNPGMNYFWSTAQTTQTITVTTPGLYIVAVTDANGCVATDTINITNSPLTVNLGPDRDICGNTSLTLNAGNPGLSYLWSDNSTGNSLNVTSPGTYWVEVTDPQGCTAADSIVVGQRSGLVAGIAAPASTNLMVPVNFTDNSTGNPVSWEWNFGDGSALATQQNPTHTFVALGIFTVQLIVNDGYCSDTTTHEIEVAGVIGIEESELFETLKVYPNPSADRFQLEVSLMEAHDLSLEVRNLQGQVVWQQSEGLRQELKTVMDLSTLPKGIYILSLRVGERPVFKKLILQ